MRQPLCQSDTVLFHIPTADHANQAKNQSLAASVTIGMEIAEYGEQETQGVSDSPLNLLPGMEHTMALAVTEAEPEKAIHPASCYVDSETRWLYPACGDAPALFHAADERRKLRAIHSALVVEDDPDISLALQDLLEFEGLHVDCVPTCRQAFAAIAQNTYDVVLLDLGLPDGDGSSILEHLQVSHPSLPVIILTASNRDLGPLPAFARVTKPWVKRDLCSVVHRALGTTSISVAR